MSSRVLTQTDVLPAVADPERLAVLEQTGLLDTGADPTFDRLARLAAALVGAPVSFVSLVGLDQQVMPGAVDLGGGDVGRDLPIAESFCQYAVATGEPLVIPDTRTDPLVRENALVTRREVLAYAGIPLATESGHVLGTLCVVDRRARDWDDRQLGLLRDLAALVELEIHHRLTAGRIVGVQGLGRRMADSVASLGDALTGLVELADQQDHPRLQRYAAVTRSRYRQLGELARDLRSAALPPEEGVAVGRPETVDLRKVVERAVASIRAVTHTAALHTAITPIPLAVRCDPLQLERSVSHVVLTALHHAEGDAPVEVRLAPVGEPGPAEGDAELVAAELTVLAPRGRVPAAELGRVVGRFSATSCEEGAAGGGDATPATIKVAGGAVTAHSGIARGRSSRDDGSSFTVRWRLHRGPRPASITLP